MQIKTRLLTAFESLRTNFWFVPATMFIVSVLLAKVFIAVDQLGVFKDVKILEFVYQSDADTITSLLTMLAGSMITVTSIVFSITVLSLSMASSQFGPRLIRHFMADSGTKMVLGTFLATFIYCLLIIEVTDEFQSRGDVPGMSVYVAVMLALLSICVLIFFIHHVARSIQADQVISDVESRLRSNIDRLFPEEPEWEARPDACYDEIDLSEHFTAHEIVRASTSGYVQAIDYDALESLTKRYQCAVVVDHLPGNFVVEGTCLITIYHQLQADLKQCQRELRNTIMLGSQRTPVQDPEFAVHQLVEIAVRALSPGVNDPYSAITCVDKLSAVMCQLTRVSFPPTCLVDEQGKVRVKRKQLRFADIGAAAFDQIRQNASDNVAVTIRLLDGLLSIAIRAVTPEHREFVRRQLMMIEQIQSQQQWAEGDKQDMFKRIEQVGACLTAEQSH